MLSGHKKTVIALYANAQYIASSATSKTVKIWYTETGRCKRTIDANTVVRTMQISGRLLLTGNDDGEFTIRDIETDHIVKVRFS